MGNLVAKEVSLHAKKFNKLRSKLLPVGVTSKLLSKDGFTENYLELFDVANWYYTHNTYTKETTITIATLDDVFREKFQIASDITIGQDVYEINKRDSRSPDGNKPYWQVYCTKTEFLYVSTGDPVPLSNFFWENVEW